MLIKLSSGHLVPGSERCFWIGRSATIEVAFVDRADRRMGRFGSIELFTPVE
jgi:hypothetical protein